MTVKIKVDDRDVKRVVGKFKKESQQARFMKEIGKIGVADSQNRVRSTKTAPTGARWAPWSYHTMEQRRKQGNAARGLLYSSGRLLGSIYSRMKGRNVILGASAPYAGYLQFGTRKMPARPFLGWSDRMIGKIKKLVKKRFRKIT